MQKNDIYFQKAWQSLYAEREGYPMDSVHFECEHGQVDYAFLLRPIEIRGEKYPYVDIVTPYAFAGPLLDPVNDTPEGNRELALAFDEYFDAYCKEHGIVAEYCQFCPWLKLHEYFGDLYEMEYRSHIVGIDLTKPDLMMDELDGRRRRAVRSALKQGVEVIYDYTGKHMDDFMRLYQYTVEKYDVTDYYRFDRAFIEKLFEDLKGQVYFACCMYEGACVSICIAIQSEEFLHYYLAGHDPDMLHLNAGSLLIYSVACKGQSEGKKVFILGGAEGKLMEFKRTFTRDCYFDYYVGKRVRNSEVYTMLTEKNGVFDTVFFPKYRDNGAIQIVNWMQESSENESE